MYIINIKALCVYRPCGFRKEFLNFHFKNLFLPCVMVLCSGLDLLGNIRIISAMFGRNEASSVRGDVLCGVRQTTDIQ